MCVSLLLILCIYSCLQHSDCESNHSQSECSDLLKHRLLHHRSSQGTNLHVCQHVKQVAASVALQQTTNLMIISLNKLISLWHMHWIFSKAQLRGIKFPFIRCDLPSQTHKLAAVSAYLCSSVWHHAAFKHTVTATIHDCVMCAQSAPLNNTSHGSSQQQSITRQLRPTPFVYISTLHPCIPVVDLAQTD